MTPEPDPLKAARAEAEFRASVEADRRSPCIPKPLEDLTMALAPNAPCDLGRDMGSQLARWVDSKLAGRPDLADGRCDSCAFRAGTHPNGCLSTVADALKCLMEGDVKFLCHDGIIETGKPAGVCRGFAILAEGRAKDREPVVMPWGYSDEVNQDKQEGQP